MFSASVLAIAWLAGGGLAYRPGAGLLDPSRQAHFSLEYSRPFAPAYSPYYLKMEGGVFTDSYKGAESSGFFSLGVGVQVGTGAGPFARASFAPTWISAPDRYLGSHGQFAQDLVIGVADSRGGHIGLAAKHLSNAGIVKPNLGRNFLTLQIALPL